MFSHAKQIMEKEKAAFVATGEVLGQRPMSQHSQALELITQESGLGGYLLRPLSALLLPVTIPQQKGWIRDEFLFDIQGRSRTRQIALAKDWGIEEYPWPGGGCLLTETEFCRRLKDVLRKEPISSRTVEFLKCGRFFRVAPSFCLSVGRNEQENKKLIQLIEKDDVVFEPLSLPGPTAVGRGKFDEYVKFACARIVARYTMKDKIVKVRVRSTGRSLEEIVDVCALQESQLMQLRV
jgi:hypothetical protein